MDALWLNWVKIFIIFNPSCGLLHANVIKQIGQKYRFLFSRFRQMRKNNKCLKLNIDEFPVSIWHINLAFQ